MHIERHTIEHSVDVAADAAAVWREVTEVDISAFHHPTYLSLLGVPKPLRAELVAPGVGGVRNAFFSNGLCFSQEITEWQEPERYAFTFKPDAGFRVAYCLDLCNGPFRMVAGEYRLRRIENGTHLSLLSRYELHGVAGAGLGLPVRLVLHLFQIYLLRGVRSNAERRALREG